MMGDEARKERGMKIIAGCIVFGIILVAAPSIVSWLTGYDLSSTSQYLPETLSEKLVQVLQAMQYGGAILMVFGLIYGGYEYSVVPEKPAGNK
ncbi:MAG: hypothetical protein QXG08_01095 [Candidatus Methanomethyliaceae archaeon]